MLYTHIYVCMYVHAYAYTYIYVYIYRACGYTPWGPSAIYIWVCIPVCFICIFVLCTYVYELVCVFRLWPSLRIGALLRITPLSLPPFSPFCCLQRMCLVEVPTLLSNPPPPQRIFLEATKTASRNLFHEHLSGSCCKR